MVCAASPKDEQGRIAEQCSCGVVGLYLTRDPRETKKEESARTAPNAPLGNTKNVHREWRSRQEWTISGNYRWENRLERGLASPVNGLSSQAEEKVCSSLSLI